MVDAISGKNYEYSIPYENYFASERKVNSDDSIFLEEKFEEIQDKQGMFGKFWNGVKEITTLGQSSSDCESMLEKYKNGEVSFAEAVEYLEEYEKKQDTMTNLQANILTGIGGIAVATTAAAAGPIGWGLAIAAGAPIGAVLKTGLKTIDRATNDVQGDEFDVKQMGKDAISGALTGVTSAVSSGVGLGITKANLGLSLLNGTKCGLICGSVSSAGNYLTDVAFGDEDFNFNEFATDTLTGAFVSGTVGAVVGGGMYGIAQSAGEVGKETTKEVVKNVTKTIVKDSTSSTARKILGQAERNIIAA